MESSLEDDAASADLDPGFEKYRLRQKIGEGAFGEVFAADQWDPVERQVAVKILKVGKDGDKIIARFEAERQVLALMNHRNIATVFDGGETSDGRPYFVMEFVDGPDVLTWCEERNADLETRLQLFQEICDGVVHAHARGVIHRDIKPQNVIVEEKDGVPVPKVIDFGIAKLTGPPDMAIGPHTDFGEPLGTPAYMSPEQVDIQQRDIDVRTDVYSLGALLFELLVGSPPIESQELRKAGWKEIGRVIREQDPGLPSRKLAERTATGHSTSPLRPRKVRGELDWIVMRALEKERNRRYGSVTDLSKDVENFLRGRAVEARRPSTTYRFRKWSQRNWIPLSTAAAFVGLIAAGVWNYTSQLLRAEKAEAEVEMAEAEVERRAEISDTLNSFIEDDLIAAALEEGLTGANSAINTLKKAEEKIENQLGQHPLAEAGARLLIARTYLGIAALFEKQSNKVFAYPLFVKSANNAKRAREIYLNSGLAPANERLIGSEHTLARAYLHTLRAKEALQVLTSSVDRIGEELDLTERNQYRCALLAVEAAGRAGDVDEFESAVHRLMRRRFDSREAWVYLHEAWTARGRQDDTVKGKAALIGSFIDESGTWLARDEGLLKEPFPEPGFVKLSGEEQDRFVRELQLPDIVTGMLIAHVQALRGEFSAAVETLERIEIADSAQAHPVMHLQAWYLERDGRIDEAVQIAREAIQFAAEAPVPDDLDLVFYSATWHRLNASATNPARLEGLPIGEPVVDPRTGHRYALIRFPMPWEEAQRVCESLGGHLATVSDREENAFLYLNFATERVCWLGGSDAEDEGKWEWVTGEAMDFKNWLRGQPNDRIKRGKEDYLTFGSFDYREIGIKWRWTPRSRWGDDPGHGLAFGDLKSNPLKAMLVEFPICEWEADQDASDETR